MECHKKLATEAKELAEETIVGGNDVSGALKLALKARRLYPKLEGIDQLISVLNVLLAAADTKDYSGNRDYYRILQVDPHAKDNVIKKQYRKIALNVHPDKNPSVGAEEAFKLVTEAFEVLSDERKRALYDQGVWHGLSEISQVDIESLLRKINKSREDWEKRKAQMSEKDLEKLQTRIKKLRDDWKIRKMDMSNEYMESLRRRMNQAEEGWKKRRMQMSEEDIENSRRKMREEWHKKRSQRSDEDLERSRMKKQKDREEWEKRRSQMSQEGIESSRLKMEKAKEEMVRRRMERKMKKAEEQMKREMQPRLKFEED